MGILNSIFNKAEKEALDALLRKTELSLFGRTKEHAQYMNICIECGKTPIFKTGLDKAEYQISAFCPDCFNKVFQED